MPEEGEAEISIGPDAVEPLVGKARGFFDGVGAQIGQLTGLEIALHQFDRVEVVPVGGEPLDDKPAALIGDPGLHHLGAVGR